MNLEDIDQDLINHFRTGLLKWATSIDRPLPWKGNKDPYVIWVSEIILQQTRAKQGTPYFLRFIDQFPTVKHLAEADLDQVMKAWEGLGYYSRAQNMHESAKKIYHDFSGKFPDNYKEILALKGVGPYTAAAISSFAFNLPYAVVDGNVLRVLSRYFGLDIPIDSSEGKKLFSDLAEASLDKNQAGTYNQAIMDFGAIQCKPRNPDCANCPLSGNCQALSLNKVNDLPVKKSKISRKDRFFNYLEIICREEVLITRRNAKDIWKNLYQFPLIETSAIIGSKELTSNVLWKEWIPQKFELIGKSRIYKQTLTHQNIFAAFWRIRIKEFPPQLPDFFVKVDKESIRNYAFPKIIDCFLQNNSLILELDY